MYTCSHSRYQRRGFASRLRLKRARASKRRPWTCRERPFIKAPNRPWRRVLSCFPEKETEEASGRRYTRGHETTADGRRRGQGSLANCFICGSSQEQPSSHAEPRRKEAAQAADCVPCGVPLRRRGQARVCDERLGEARRWPCRLLPGIAPRQDRVHWMHPELYPARGGQLSRPRDRARDSTARPSITVNSHLTTKRPRPNVILTMQER